ncbi:glycosyltransferase [Nitrolancea hollandica]|uniref:Putative Glycosyl transferase n=1 Tax=Nitrolancea hollandica Lb TaxID=1129897 RepID=I4EEQ4_9BACT|nr:glycosyltransferase family 2 protein [Nitrolancea hollandica]CCF83166.1 putative Glycosyl transferase [Nitrolancea hollandica Lb]
MSAVARPALDGTRKTNPSVSVLLPAWNDAAMIGRCLESLLAIDRPDLEIIVCAGGEDGTLDVARRYAGERVIVLEQYPGEGKQGALRRCFAHSRGDIIYLTDADCVVPPDVFDAVIGPVADGDVLAATGTSRPLAEQSAAPFALFQWSILDAVEQNRPVESTGLLGRNCAASRAAVIEAGAFAEPVPIGTDYHLAKALLARGEHIRFVPAAVETPYPTSPLAFLRQQSRWLRNIFLHGPRYGDNAEIRACARTVALGAGFYLWPLSWRWTRLPGLLIWLTGLTALVALRVRYARALSARRGVVLGPAYYLRLPWYTLLDVAAWVWPLVDAVSRRRRLRW